jgi:hypothetical protein
MPLLYIFSKYITKCLLRVTVEAYIVQNMLSASAAELKIVLSDRRDYLVWYLEILNWNFYIDAHMV